MGGDYGPKTTVEGVAMASKIHPNVKFMLFGDKDKSNNDLLIQENFDIKSEDECKKLFEDTLNNLNFSKNLNNNAQLKIKNNIKSEIFKKTSEIDEIISITIVGSFIDKNDLSGISDIDVIVICKSLNKNKSYIIHESRYNKTF